MEENVSRRVEAESSRFQDFSPRQFCQSVKVQFADCMVVANKVCCVHENCVFVGAHISFVGLASFSFVPVIEEQVFNPVEKIRVSSKESCEVHSASKEAKAYHGFFFSKHDGYCDV